MDKAILVIDMLDEFIYGKLKSDPAAAIIPNIKKLIENARKFRVPVIYTCDCHLESDPELEIWGAHAMKGTKGAEIVDDLKPKDADYVIEKRTYSAFYQTNLEELLESRGVKKIYLTGILTNICVKHTAADAFFRGFKIVVVEDCTEALSDEEQKNALEEMKKMYMADFKRTQEVIDEISK